MQQTAGVVPEPNNLRQVHGDRLWNRRQADVPRQLCLTGVNHRLPRHLRQHNCCRTAPLSVYCVYAFNCREQTHTPASDAPQIPSTRSSVPSTRIISCVALRHSCCCTRSSFCSSAKDTSATWDSSTQDLHRWHYSVWLSIYIQ